MISILCINGDVERVDVFSSDSSYFIFFRSVNPFRLIGVGLSVWTFAVIGCAASFNFWSITICRMWVMFFSFPSSLHVSFLFFNFNFCSLFIVYRVYHFKELYLIWAILIEFWFLHSIACFRLVGVGEASFVSLAAPFIDDNAPAAQVTLLSS